jgi:ABC-type bacteriocin/lantibiotic exporter with double-glycine peptidase domain
MLGIASIMPFMAVVSNPDVIETNKWLNQAFVFFKFSNVKNFLISLGIILLCFIIASNLLKALTTWWTLKYDNRLNYVLARRLLAQYLARPYAYFLHRNTADMGKNILTEVRNVIAGVLSSGVQLIANSLVTFLLLCLLLIVNPVIAIAIALFLGGTYGIIYLSARKKLITISKDQVYANSMKFKTADEALSGIKDLKLLGRELVFLESFAVHAQNHSLNNIKAGIIAQIPRYALEIMGFGGILVIVLYFLGTRNDSATHIIPLLALYAYAGYRLLPALQQIFSNLTVLRFNQASLDVLHRDLIDFHMRTDPELALKKYCETQPLSFSKTLELKKVTFCYEGVEEPTVKELDLTISHNTSIGLVGATGSGKTTTVDIILGLLTPNRGQILVDGHKITEDAIARWQRNLGYVPQQIYLSDDTIKKNIAFGVPDQDIDMQAVIRAAKIANLHSFVERDLSHGYETIIGERGVRLSGGQRQRIGIARALYNDPEILIMDEATSALDGITEEAVMEALRALSGEKTLIIIAHRLTTVKECDVIYILEQGRIVDNGTYAELLKSSTWFNAASRIGSTS